ncbi:dynein heavy chain, N-terminal region 1-domain-containing protein [Lentinula lateritia]|uniref:Dynein heavy chain, N-terminal region 1-domain-containing protein n=1 Tax=Lentinula lateritia TaxID=40482 RepID=A0ABQ8VFT6_9AGAR|nr:dynein heavy chain, N-terminal region 1-domain-containing protein [Lentinula lateritia]
MLPGGKRRSKFGRRLNPPVTSLTSAYPSLLPQTTTGPSETPPTEPTAPFFDPEIFRSYLLALLPPETPYESLHAVVSCGVKPWFDAFVGARGGGKDGGDTKMGISMTKKKFAELELSLLHLQQNVEIPETHLTIHPIIQRAVEQAQAAGTRPNLLYIPTKTLNDSTFLNSLHAQVNSWIKSIQAVTKLASGTASQEINFRFSIEAELRSDEVTMVMDCLRNAKRFHATTSLSATDLDKIQESLILIFSHINRKLRLSPYPIRHVTRKHSERFIPIKVVPAHAKLQEQTRYLRDWRKQPEQLAIMTGPTKGLGSVGMEVGGMDMEEEVKEAYEVVKRIDVLDVSVEAENAYNERVSRVKNQIIARLRDRLGTARNANKMFRVFSKFNALFVRPKIHGAIQEYQTQLIDSVKEDIKHLHDKFKTQYRYSEAYHMSQMRDLPPIAGAIIWAREIKRQLLTYMKRVEDVLGKGWELYAEGQKLQPESSTFRKKLDTRPVYEAWLHDINRRNMGVDGRLFEIVRLRGGGFQLASNFDPQIITLFKEVRNLLWLGFQVPHAITNMAKDAKRVYPHAVSLMETVLTFDGIISSINTIPEGLFLVWMGEITAPFSSFGNLPV